MITSASASEQYARWDMGFGAKGSSTKTNWEHSSKVAALVRGRCAETHRDDAYYLGDH